MKRNRQLLLLLLLPALSAYSQVQQGYVKTQGRPNRPGKPLSGVTIRWRGSMNSTMSKTDGTFASTFYGKKSGDAISLLSVKKSGYELTDPDIVSAGRSFGFSTDVPIEIVMVSSAELEANTKRIKDMAYKKAAQKYQDKMAQLRQQLNDDKLTIENYERELQTLQNAYDNSFSQIERLADHYARADYDRMDSIDRRINLLIENGELDEADSLLHIVFNPATAVAENQAAKDEVEARIRQAQELIDRANAGMDDIRRDSVTAKRMIALSDSMAAEYLSQGRSQEARRCLEQSLAIRRILYGEESEEVHIINEKLKETR